MDEIWHAAILDTQFYASLQEALGVVIHHRPEGASDKEAAQRTKSQIIELLRREGEVWASFLAGVSEDFLAESFAMPSGATPASKSRFEMLLSVKEHEMHHRGQLMAAQRVLGIVPHLTRLRQDSAAQQRSASSGP